MPSPTIATDAAIDATLSAVCTGVRRSFGMRRVASTRTP